MVRIRLAKLKHYLAKSDYESFIDYQKFSAQTTKRLKIIKRSNFKAFCESLSFNSPLTNVWNKIQGFRHRLLNPPSITTCPLNQEVLEDMDAYIHSFLEMSNDFSGLDIPSLTETNVDDLLNSPVRLPPVVSNSDHAHDLFYPPFTLDELKYTLRNVKPKSSPGMDRVNFEVILHLPESSLSRLLLILNAIFEGHLFPDSWKNFLIFLLPKTTRRKFRPIALASCFLKILEKLILYRLNHWIENNNILSPFQYGFRKNRSCADNLGILSSDLHLSLATNRITAALFLDVSAAYDNVIPSILVQDLLHLGLPPKICKFIHNLTSERYISFRINGHNKGPFCLRKGLPQGCILSPVLYTIYTRNAHSVLSPGCKILEFADDIVIYFSGDKIQECISTLQRNLANLNDFFRQRGLSISPSKSKLVVFPVAFNELPDDLVITIDDQFIYPSEDTKFLGLYFHCTLSWNSHFSNLISRGQQVLNIIKYLCGTWWGSHPRILSLLFRSLARSFLEYGCHALSIFKEDKLFTKLTKLHNKFLRTILGFRISTPIVVMQAELGELPLIDRFQLLSDKFLIKCFCVSNHPVFNTLEQLYYTTKYNQTQYNLDKGFLLLKSFFKLKGFREKVLSSTIPIYYLCPYEVKFFQPTIDLSSGLIFQNSRSPNFTFNNFITNEFPNHILFFTDGSKQPDSRAGAALYSPHLSLEIQFKLSEHASIYSAEAIAIGEAIQYILDHNISNSLICSDSRSVLEATFRSNPSSLTSHLIFKIRNLLYLANQNKLNISLIWIPGHIGIDGNEIVDSLAKNATIDGQIMEFPLAHTDVWSSTHLLQHNSTVGKWLEVSETRSVGRYYLKKIF